MARRSASRGSRSGSGGLKLILTLSMVAETIDDSRGVMRRPAPLSGTRPGVAAYPPDGSGAGEVRVGAGVLPSFSTPVDPGHVLASYCAASAIFARPSAPKMFREKDR